MLIKKLYLGIYAGFLLLLSTGQSKASFVFSAPVQKGLEAAVALHKTEVNKQLQVEKAARPDNSLILLVEDYQDFYQLVFAANPNAFKAAEKSLDARLSALERDKSTGPWQLFAKGRMHIHRALLHGMQKNYLTAAIQLSKANSAIGELRKAHPDFLPGQREKALLDVIFGGVPDQYKWAASAVGWKGNEKQGMLVLKGMVAKMENSPYKALTDESRIFIAYILGFSKEEEKAAWNILRADPELAKTNLTGMYLMAKLGGKVGRNDEAIRLLLNRPKAPDYHQFPLLEYYLATAFLYQNDPRALSHYEIYLASKEPRIYKKMAVLRMAYYYMLNDDRAGVNATLARPEMSGPDLDEGDAQAAQEAQDILKAWPQADLLRARLSYDGGYYEAAWKTLEQLQPQRLQPAEQLEYHYRRAQVLNDWGKIDQAIAPYQQAIAMGKNDGNYLPANACYRLGIIYEKQGQNASAIQYFEQCLKFNKHPYTSSMSIKAKAGINRLKG
ncbi:MAG: tetratricopeptide repeat protein [Sphingobacteriaceae bacterium]|nr:tetratricopeptide repeat protein [Sphingobacteriaceae bacterium]